MKKFAVSLSATAVLALSMCSQNARAQSSVTLYGIIDAGITYLSNVNGHSTFVANDPRRCRRASGGRRRA